MTTRERRLSYTVPGLVRLRVVDGPDAGRAWSFALAPSERGEKPVEARKITGGRDRVHDVVLTDEHVSVDHFELRRSPRGLVLRDLGSTNGIRCGTTIAIEAIVGPGQRFEVGKSVLEIEKIEDLEVTLSNANNFGEMYGQSPTMREVFARLERLATAPRLSRILVSGENGTGKELAVRGLHARSRRCEQPFVVFDCAAAPRELVRSRLFGHERGAYTGAHSDRVGCLRAADGGVLFIDEIGELPLDTQAALLRVLQTGEVTPLGSERVERIDAWVIAATHRDLKKMVSERRFREDLYYRLNVLPVTLPPLRERGDDVLFLARRFLDREAAAWNRPRLSLDDSACLRLRQSSWPGNVRQLDNVIVAAAFQVYTLNKRGTVVRGSDLEIEANDTPSVSKATLNLPLRHARERFERDYLKNLLAKHERLKDAAAAAEVPTETLRRLRIKHRLDASGNTRPIVLENDGEGDDEGS